FTSESASGWQTVNFSSPVTISPDTTYIAGYFAPNGHEAGTDGYFYPQPAPDPIGGASYISPPLEAVNSDVAANGLYTYATSPSFPTNTFEGANYWVDVIFSPVPGPGQVTNVAAIAGNQSATVNWTAPATGGTPVTYTVTPFIGSSAQTPKIVSNSPATMSTTLTGLTAGTAYTFTVTATNPNGSGPESAHSNSVTPMTPQPPDAPTGVSAIAATSQAQVSWSDPSANGSPITAYTITPYVGSSAQQPVQVNNASTTSAVLTGLTNGTAYTFAVTATNSAGTSSASARSTAVTPQDTIFDFGVPAVIDSGDPTSVEVGVKFTSDTSGQITAIRFYKAPTNTGTHLVSLWTADGTLLASATSTNETASGWQTAKLSTPVTINADSTYVAGYFDPNGHYSFTSQGLATNVDNAPLHAISNATSANGVYAITSTSAFPAQTWQAANYFVDVQFAPSPPGQVSNVTATAGNQAATVNWTAPGGQNGYTVTPYIGSSAQTPTQITNASATSTTVPGLTNGTAYTFTVTATNPNGSGPESAHSNSVTPMTPQP
ncbi:MAG: DUF4082 domain-containing protein, partial [Trebonia sp.]